MMHAFLKFNTKIPPVDKISLHKKLQAFLLLLMRSMFFLLINETQGMVESQARIVLLGNMQSCYVYLKKIYVSDFYTL
jgi:hypothetical protein